MVNECHMTLRLVTRSLPRSPELPLVSSMLSSRSIRTSPGLIFICLNIDYTLRIIITRLLYCINLRYKNVKSNFSMLPNVINRSSLFRCHCNVKNIYVLFSIFYFKEIGQIYFSYSRFRSNLTLRYCHIILAA